LRRRLRVPSAPTAVSKKSALPDHSTRAENRQLHPPLTRLSASSSTPPSALGMPSPPPLLVVVAPPSTPPSVIGGGGFVQLPSWAGAHWYAPTSQAPVIGLGTGA